MPFGLNPYSNGMMIERGFGLFHSEGPDGLNPYSNGMIIEQEGKAKLTITDES